MSVAIGVAAFGLCRRNRFKSRLRAAALLCGALFSVTTAANGAQPLLVADTHVNSSLPTVNSGTISNLNVGGGFTALLQFDLSLLPSGTTAAKVSRAILRLYCNRVTTPGLVNLSPINAAWGEYSVTYATEPAMGSATGIFTASQAGAFIAIDVTTLVQGWISNPASNNGIALSAGTAFVQFDSKENDQTAHAPTLEVELVDAGPAGATGATGATGPIGLTGVQGPQGPIGATGQQGPIGLTGSTGLAGATGSAGPQGLPGSIGPSGPKGDQGIQGIPGLAGAQGIPGAKGDPGSIGPTGLTGATGAAGTAGATGPAGATGATGTSGAAGMTFIGSWLSGRVYSVNDAVTFGTPASTYIATSSNSSMEPDLYPSAWTLLAQAGGIGPAGATGPAGAAATVSIDPAGTSTGAAGSPASVTNIGTVSAAVLHFTIPQGATGPSGGGGGGGGGTSGIPFSSVYHSVSYANAYYSVNNTNASTSQAAPHSVLTWVPTGCTATSLSVFSEQSGTMTVTLRVGSSSGSMAPTALACTPPTGGGICTATDSIIVPASGFVDFIITGTSGTLAGVWTALTCN